MAHSKAASAQQTRPLAAQAKSSYLHFIWGMSFGVVSVLVLPLVAAAAWGLLAFKSSHDKVKLMWQS